MSSDEESPYAPPTKCGLKRGQQLNKNKKNEVWYLACEKFSQEKSKNPKLSYGKFLASDLSDAKFVNTKSQRMLFGNYLKRHRDGTLTQVALKRAKVRKFVSVETKMITYLNLRAM